MRIVERIIVEKIEKRRRSRNRRFYKKICKNND